VPSQPEPLLAAVFDFDGTLVDTMPLHYEAYRRAILECCGADLPAELFYAQIGGTAREVVPRLLQELGCEADWTEVHTRKKQVLPTLLRESAPPVLETAKLVPILGQSLRLALATSGSRAGVELMLEQLGWSDWFEVVVTGEDVTEGKPAPAPFLLAAERLGVAPERCVAFEDTDAGVASARAAGMTVFDVRATRRRRS
jgi:HAD superfamily hydrolase (TIGR01509 family)